jgi:hypothetical protein
MKALYGYLIMAALLMAPSGVTAQPYVPGPGDNSGPPGQPIPVAQPQFTTASVYVVRMTIPGASCEQQEESEDYTCILVAPMPSTEKLVCQPGDHEIYPREYFVQDLANPLSHPHHAMMTADAGMLTQLQPYNFSSENLTLYAMIMCGKIQTEAIPATPGEDGDGSAGAEDTPGTPAEDDGGSAGAEDNPSTPASPPAIEGNWLVTQNACAVPIHYLRINQKPGSESAWYIRAYDEGKTLLFATEGTLSGPSVAMSTKDMSCTIGTKGDDIAFHCSDSNGIGCYIKAEGM